METMVKMTWRRNGYELQRNSIKQQRPHIFPLTYLPEFAGWKYDSRARNICASCRIVAFSPSPPKVATIHLDAVVRSTRTLLATAAREGEVSMYTQYDL